MLEVLSKGHYAKKQICCKDPIIAWSHKARYQKAVELCTIFEGSNIADYGCGDGTLIALLMSGNHAPSHAVGYELYPEVVKDCRERFMDLKNVEFELISSLKTNSYSRKFDGIICTEVLEHVSNPSAIIEELHLSLRDAGMAIISVPVEIGPSLFFKEMLRGFARRRHIGEYSDQDSYSFKEFIQSLFAGKTQHITRPLLKDMDGFEYYEHKGFNWHVLCELLKNKFRIIKIVGSPVRFFPMLLASQAWIVAEKKNA